MKCATCGNSVQPEANYCGNCGKLPTTVQVKTPHGMHLYFTYIEGSKNSVGVIGAGIDIRSEGGFVVAPPTPGYEFATTVVSWFAKDEPLPAPYYHEDVNRSNNFKSY